jgi:prepilin-type N-terminal cleavage/methylation domain-containing protein
MSLKPTLPRVLKAKREWSSLAPAGYSLIEILVVVGLIGVITAVAVPMTSNSLKGFRITGDVRTLTNTVSLAKMRAASTFDQARVYVDLSVPNYHVETWQKTGAAWVTEGGSIGLSTGVSMGFSGLTTAPPNTQTTLAQAPQCRTAAGVAIGNTACVVFNSRGIPIDSTGSPTALDAVYLTDGMAVYGVTVSATGLVQLWNSKPSTATWAKQ